jgi:hypothetical protein
MARYRDISNHADDEQPPGIAVVRLDEICRQVPKIAYRA